MNSLQLENIRNFYFYRISLETKLSKIFMLGQMSKYHSGPVLGNSTAMYEVKLNHLQLFKFN